MHARPADDHRRVTAIDAARGLAMILVCLSHFVSSAPPSAVAEMDILMTISMIASPTFMLMSGITLGMLYATLGASFGRLRIRLIDRGVFLMTAGHLAVLGAFVIIPGWEARDLQRTFITDAIGVAVIFGALVITHLSARTRIQAALCLYAFAWAVSYLWEPTAGTGLLVKDIVFGPGTAAALVNSFPVLPWVAVHLGATAIGEWTGRQLVDGDTRPVAARWMSMGLIAVVAAVLLKGAYLMGRPISPGPGWDNLYALTTPFTKRPPGLVYLLFFGGVGMMLTGAVVAIAEWQFATRAMTAFATLGQASLFIYVAQFYVYRAFLPLAPGLYGIAWPATFVLTIGLLWMLARWWTNNVGNGVLTVGITALAKRYGQTPRRTAAATVPRSASTNATREAGQAASVAPRR